VSTCLACGARCPADGPRFCSWEHEKRWWSERERLARSKRPEVRIPDRFDRTVEWFSEKDGGECALVIPGTFVACGEGGNYCSERCRKEGEK
jgi:hypothetical protein